jgi:ADP-heptose:LPS heptosyltransferase
MIPILTTCGGVDEFYFENPPPPFDVQAPLVSLPGILKTDLNSIPAEVPYLSVPADLIENWRKTLPADGRLRVGINWQGTPTFRWDRSRSMPLAEFAPLSQVEGVRLISLQKGSGIEQLAHAPFDVEDLGSRLDLGDAAFCDTAAVIKNLDLVITSDTAVAHLAGALGAPVWLALSFTSDWRWLLDRQDSPWYPTMRLFRQSVAGQWHDVFANMADQLRHLVAARR